jgi:hypothetical protein
MKHKHINIKLLPMEKVKLPWFVMICMLFLQNPAKTQFIGSGIDSSASIIEVRKGSVVEYSLETDAGPGDEFRWEVTGGKIITSGAVGSGTVASPSILEFTEDMHTIEVQWQADDSTSGFFTGDILVQKKPASGCVSLITKQAVILWSMPTASIDRNYSDFTICSGDSAGGYIVVNLTGAASFSFSYSIKSNGLNDETGNAINTEHNTITTSNDTAHIILPAILTNPSEAASKYFTIELTAMNDDFSGDGEIVPNREEFTITVYPSVTVGIIKSTKLNRR